MDNSSNTNSESDLLIRQLMIIRTKEDATEEIINIIENNLIVGDTNDNNLFIKAKSTTLEFYKYLTEESLLKEEILKSLEFLIELNNQEYINEVVRNVAKYILSPTEYIQKVELSYQVSGLEKRKFPISLENTLLEALKECKAYTNAGVEWDFECIKLNLFKAAEEQNIDIDWSFFNKRFFETYLVLRVFPSHPELKLPLKALSDDFWETHKETILTLTKQTKTGVVIDDSKLNAYIFEKTGINYTQRTLERKLTEYNIRIIRSGLSKESIKLCIENLKIKGIKINWENIALELKVNPISLKAFCSKNNIDIVDKDSILEVIKTLEMSNEIVTINKIAEILNTSFRTIYELIKNENYKISEQDNIAQAIKRLKLHQIKLTYSNVIKNIVILLDSSRGNISRSFRKYNITIFSAEEIENAINYLSQNLSRQFTIEDIAYKLNTDIPTLLRDLKLLGYDISSISTSFEEH